MDFNDIRSCHDVKGHGQRTALAILNGRPPSSKDIAANPGLACLIVSQNPILRVAWHPFGDEPEEIERATISMDSLIEELASQGFSPEDSLYSLCESSLMRRTFWAHRGIRVVRPPAQANVGSQDAAGSYLHAGLLEFHPAQRPGQTLQSFADEFFEATTARPPIVRILYHSDQKQPIDFNDLRSSHPPVSTGDASSSTAVREKKYVLLAIVRLNGTKTKNDYVGTYSINGHNIIVEYEPPTFMAHRWSVRDAPFKYMLIYGLHESWSNNRTDFASLPEIATYPVSQGDVSFLGGVHDDLMGLMLALKAPEAESAATAGDTQQSSAWNVKENSPGYGSDRRYKE
ncbi:hypothetical protein FACUT_13802 [Fusarium acutatum]|uniref:Uncharacterized protein n=1 Tax=Fusarium acutatum TaxID=78861 RepID=A0A8H4JAX9_9HYPO|nr:hypothetical protein FACUT_13802 [Fusarium acutatum]